jgi:multicomponent Na+:H+ antiporter subunit F
MITPDSFLPLALQIALGVLLLSMVLVIYRLARGPKAADRVVAMDLLTVLVLAFLIVFAVYSREKSFLDVAIAFACISFLGTVAMARFLLRAYRQFWCARQEGETDE